jgi:hypothetical protein
VVFQDALVPCHHTPQTANVSLTASLGDAQVTEEMASWPLWDRLDTAWQMMVEQVR